MMGKLPKSIKELDAMLFQNMSIDNLEIIVHDKICEKIAHDKIFDFAMGWLNEQIKQDTVTQSERELRIFVGMLHNRNYEHLAPVYQLPIFTLEQVDEAFRQWLEKDAIDEPAYTRRYLITQQDVHRLFASEAKATESDESGSTEDPKPTIKSPTQEQSGICLKAAQTHASAKPCETISIDSSPRREYSPTSTTTLPQGRKTMVSSNSPEPSRLPNKKGKYICKRCEKPGHFLHQCPTNLDPLYDTPPPREYRCTFCGLYGNHYAILCRKNPNEDSLVRQRERAATKTQEPRTPNRNGRPFYRSTDSSTRQSRGRARSRSPKQYHQEYYRSRSRDRYYPRRTAASCDDPHNRNEDDGADESDVSPYTARARLTQKHHGSSKSNQYGDSSSHSERRRYTFSPSRYTRSPLPERTRNRHKDLGKMPGKSDEGRLAFEDEVSVTTENTPPSPSCSIAPPSPRCDVSPGERELSRKISSPTNLSPDDPNKIREKTEGFLSALAAQIMSKGQDHPQFVVVDTYDHKMEDNCDSSCEAEVNDNNSSGTATEYTLPASHIDSGLGYQPVHSPRFSPEVVSLFNARENPIINIRAKRKTASQMMNDSECLRTYCSKTAASGTAASGTAASFQLPCRSQR